MRVLILVKKLTLPLSTLYHTFPYWEWVIVDDGSPDKEAQEKLKEIETFNTPVVALTANAITGMKEMYLKEGFDYYLSKPINVTELDKVIHKCFNEIKNNNNYINNSNVDMQTVENKETYKEDDENSIYLNARVDDVQKKVEFQ